MAEKKEAKPQSNNNLRFYEQLRTVPYYALKNIQAGRLKGMSDINPLYRIKAMTEAFGPCGIGWKYEITKQWQETYGVEVKSFTNINLYIKVDGQWSDPIPGTGGATIVENSRNGLYVNDEGHKMSLTDALSVAMKSLGVAADIYYSKDKEGQFDTKYDQQSYAAQQRAQPVQQKTQQTPVQAEPEPQPQVQVDPKAIMQEIASATTEAKLVEIYQKYPLYQQDANFTGALTARKDQIRKNGKS